MGQQILASTCNAFIRAYCSMSLLNAQCAILSKYESNYNWWSEFWCPYCILNVLFTMLAPLQPIMDQQFYYGSTNFGVNMQCFYKGLLFYVTAQCSMRHSVKIWVQLQLMIWILMSILHFECPIHYARSAPTNNGSTILLQCWMLNVVKIWVELQLMPMKLISQGQFASQMSQCFLYIFL
jgi:hypothetical protein